MTSSGRGKADMRTETTKSDFSPSESKYFLTPSLFWCHCWKFVLLCSTTWSEILTPVKEEPSGLRFGGKLTDLHWLYLYFLCEYSVTFSVAFLFRNLKIHLVVEDGYWFLSCVTQICLQHVNLTACLDEARGAHHLAFFQYFGRSPSRLKVKIQEELFCFVSALPFPG